MGHGKCETFNKQTALIGPGGQSTDDPVTIGEHAWRLLKSFDFDAKELRGIGIMIQKLESTTGPVQDLGQAVLLFKAAPKPVTAVPEVVLHPPSSQEPIIMTPVPRVDKGKGRASPAPFNVLLPNFSQMDMSVYNELPEDLRRELEIEIERRSVSPAIVDPKTSKTESSSTVTQLSEPPTSKFAASKAMINAKHVRRLVAIKGNPSIAFDKQKFFGKRAGPSYATFDASDADLRKLGMDPEVFALLPLEIKKEQLSGARIKQTTGFLPVAGLEDRVVIKQIKRKARSPYATKPFPKARFVEEHGLKQQGKPKGEILMFTATDDLQTVIEKWVLGFREHPPNQRDVDYFAKFLVGCVDGGEAGGDVGVEKGVKVAKWWLFLLRKFWSRWETVNDAGSTIEKGPDGRWGEEMVAKAWWRAFKGVRTKMDLAARKRFGGCLSLR